MYTSSSSIWETCAKKLWQKSLHITCFGLHCKSDNNYLHAGHIASVMSDSLWPYELQPSRLLCPWGFWTKKWKGYLMELNWLKSHRIWKDFILSNKWTAESESHIYVLWPLTAVSICLARSSKCCLGNLHCYWLKSS